VPPGASVSPHRAAPSEVPLLVMTNDDDRTINCVDCGQPFLFTAGEQAFYASKGLTNAPTRCRACRDARKQQRTSAGGESGGGSARAHARGAPPRELHTVVCADCGTETQVPFVPVANRPVYCRNCYDAHRPDRAERGAGAPRPKRSEAPRAGAPSEGGHHARGEVKSFNEAKGFGFLREDSGEEVFVHFSSILGDGFRTLREGERVEFDVVMGPKGKQAANVMRLD
jgi:CxxC-x17-CxxC domain-containing protein